MKKKQWLILILTLATLALSACAAPTKSSEDACPTPTNDLKLLTNAEDGYCLLYPAAYSTDLPRYIVINPINSPGDIPGDAWVSIYAEAAAGRTAAQVADAEIAAVGEGFNITRTDIVVDGAQGVMVDGLPGQDSNRQVFIVNNAKLYRIMFAPWTPNIDAYPQLEELYKTVIQTLHFLPPA